MLQLRKLVRRWRYGDSIVVVSGIPRSGTSMLMRMLEAGGMAVVSDGARRADEDNPRGYFELEKITLLGQDKDTSWLRDSRGRVVKIISHLLETLPDENHYQVVLVDRDLSEVVASQNIMLTRRGEANTVSDDAAKDAFRKHLLKVKARLRSKPNFELCELSHDQILADPTQAARRLSAFLGSALDEVEMAAAVDPKLYRNRQRGARTDRQEPQ